MKKKRLFIDTDHAHGTVVLNWHGTPEREFSYFARSFHSVARKAVEELRLIPHFGIHGNPIDDFQAYPIVFLYRHTLELYMKAIILAGSPILTSKGLPIVTREELLKTHDLDTLRQELERIFKACNWGWDFGTPHFQSLDDFREVISEIHEVDKRSDVFRYPLRTNGRVSLPSHFRFNLFELCQVLDSLFPALEGAVIGAHERPTEAMSTDQVVGKTDRDLTIC